MEQKKKKEVNPVEFHETIPNGDLVYEHGKWVRKMYKFTPVPEGSNPCRAKCDACGETHWLYECKELEHRYWLNCPERCKLVAVKKRRK